MQNNIVFLGCTNGYGYAFSACNTKVEFMARGLSEQGDICYIHNGTSGKEGIFSPQYHKLDGIATVVDYPAKGSWYVSPFRNHSLLLSDLRQWHRPDSRNWVIVEAPYLPFYYLNIYAARKAGYKVAVISHEWLGSFQNRNCIKRWVNHLYSRVFGYGVDAILPISEYIRQKIRKFGKPYLKVPVLADFAQGAASASHEPFFLYCVSAEYLRVIEVVLRGFVEFLKLYPGYELLLVLSGGEEAMKAVSAYIKENGLTGMVKIKHRLPYDELKSLYSRASGLIVALNPEFEQDKARFSQKIAEYLSTGSVLISNNVGEMNYYFTDRENILMDEYSPQGFYRSFCWIAEHPEKAQEIGYAGYELGKKEFDYKQCGIRFHDFLSAL